MVTILLVLIMAARTPLDSDFFWHLRAGEWMVENRAPVLNDYFSNSVYGNPWVNHSWLAQVIFYLVFRFTGFTGIGLLTALLATAAMVFVFFTMQGNYFFRALLVILASTIASFVWSPRPQLFSLLLLGWLAYLLYIYKWKQKNHLWQLPVIFVLWANLHGGYPLGLVLIAAYAAGEMANHLLGIQGETVLPWRKILQVMIWGILSIPVLWINPNGFQIYLIPFQTMGGEVLQRFIQEWASPDFHDLSQQVFLLAIFLMVFLNGYSIKRMDMTDMLIFIGFAYMALVARRNYGPFAIAAVPVLSRQLEPTWNQWIKNIKETEAIKKINYFFEGQEGLSKPLPGNLGNLINILIILLLLFVFTVKLIWTSGKEMIEQTTQNNYPLAAVEWLKQNKPEGILLNEYNSGGYLVWALREYPVFVDGRTDMYGDQILKDWVTLVQVEKGWQTLLEKYHIGIVMVEPDRPIVERLIENRWTKGYEDSLAVILLSPDE